MADAQTHELKTVRPWFPLVYHGEKTAELRKHDRDFRVGDILLLREYIPDECHYTGSAVKAKITHIVTDADGPWLTRDHCMISFIVLELIP